MAWLEKAWRGAAMPAHDLAAVTVNVATILIAWFSSLQAIADRPCSEDHTSAGVIPKRTGGTTRRNPARSALLGDFEA
jgi:hypothetical protein